MDRVPLDRLEGELGRELRSASLAARYAEWSRREPALARFARPSELVRSLRRRSSPAQEDELLLALLAMARTDPAAGRLVLYALLPGLKGVARRTLTGADEREELWSVLLACAWERLLTYPLQRRPRRVAANVVLDTLHETLRTMREIRGVERPIEWEPRDDGPATPPNEEGADVGLLLGRAAAQGAISRAEAELVLATRFDGCPLAEFAAARGEPYNRVKVRRQRAERRLLMWLGYRPVPRGPQERPLPITHTAGPLRSSRRLRNRSAEELRTVRTLAGPRP